ncbi:MAG: hypothetical protein JSV08_03440 [Acidobacteriota bacterium]|nr:MAG: hypothetical protein JSV08_03440 [Acidobacteriota bacterium]
MAAASALAQPAAPAQPAPVILSTSVEPTTARVGDVVTLTVRIVHPPEAEILAPAMTTAAWDLRDVSLTPVEPGITQVDMELAPFALGEEVFFPPFEFHAQTEDGVESVSLEPLSIAVESVLEEGETELADLKPPMKLAFELPWGAWAALAAAAVLLGLLLWYLVRRSRRGYDAAREEPREPPYEEAVHALERLEREQLLEHGQLKTYYDRLSFILRRYLERQFEVPILERTTQETHQLLRFHVSLRDYASEVHDVLTRADMVKFAKGTASLQEGEKILHHVRDVIERSRPLPQVSEMAALQPTPRVENRGSGRGEP